MGTEKEFDALTSEAIAASEKEFFSDAMGQEEAVVDESGDRSLEDTGKGLEGQKEADEDGEGDGDEGQQTEIEAKTESEDNSGQRDDQGRFKPQVGKTETPAERGLRNEMLSEREKRKGVETEFTNYRTQMDQRFAALEARLAQPAQATQQQPHPGPKKDEAPDRWTDPEGYDRWHRDQILREVNGTLHSRDQERMAWSFEEAKAKHGDDFQKAYAAANSLSENDPNARQLIDAVMRSPNPGERLIQWHRQQQAAREIGSDPSAYKARLADETRQALMKDPDFRKQVFEQLQTEARSPQDGSRPFTKLPPSLNSARGGSLSRGTPGGSSDAELFSDVMS